MIATLRQTLNAALGVKELWLLDAVGETVAVRTLQGDRYGAGQVLAKNDVLTRVVLPGLNIKFDNYLCRLTARSNGAGKTLPGLARFLLPLFSPAPSSGCEQQLTK